MKIEHITKLTITREESEILRKAERLLDDIYCELYDKTGLSIDNYNDIFYLLNDGSDYNIIVEGY